jgi:DNA-binding transcriptional MerR regulator
MVMTHRLHLQAHLKSSLRPEPRPASSSTLEAAMAESLTIGELAQRTGVTTSTLRYYDELGLVRPTRRVSGHRRYSDDAVTTVGVVRFLQEVGFTLAEAKRLLASRKRSPVAWRALAERKSEELRDRIAREEAARQAIEHSLVCPKDNLFDCPNFWTTVKGVLSGIELADAHSRSHRAGASTEKT